MITTIFRTVLWCFFVAALVFTWQHFALSGQVLHSMISDPHEHFPYGFVIGTQLPFMLPTLFVLGVIAIFELTYKMIKFGDKNE